MVSHIYVPDVEHVIGNHDSNKSYVVITQTNQLIQGTKSFMIYSVLHSSTIRVSLTFSNTKFSLFVHNDGSRISVSDSDPLNHSESDVLNELNT